MNKRPLIVILLLVIVICLLAVFMFPRKPPVKGPRIAIVLDDWGYNPYTRELLFEIRSPLTIAILPNLAYSTLVAEDARKHGYQTMLHLPLESKNSRALEKNILYCAMDDNQIREQLKLLLKSVPGISGVNNHQGSKGTEDARMMSVILTELKKEKLFFLDSVTTNKSVCSQVAGAVGIRFAKRDVFLDMPPSVLDEGQLRAYITRQLEQAAGIAVKRGYAVGIGHDRRTTLHVLREMMPFFEKKGIKFVFLSELVR
jgi:uncharacterized protein